MTDTDTSARCALTIGYDCGCTEIERLTTERDRYKARAERAEAALRFYGGVMPISFAPGQDGGERARAALAQIDAEPDKFGGE